MAISVVMPALEMAQETGKLIAWLKKEGDRVTKGEPLLEIETDKAVMEVEAAADGILTGIRAEEGAVIPVGQTIAWLVRPGEVPPSDAEPPESGRARPETKPALAVVEEAPAGTVTTGAKASPKARRLAKERGVDLEQIRGSGPDGAVSAEDVLSFVGTHVASTSLDAESLSVVGRLMAERTTQSWTSVPHFFLVRDVEAGALQQVRDQIALQVEETHGVKLTLTDLLVALIARVLANHPRMNSSWAGEKIRVNPDVNIAIAIAVKDGVVGAVIRNSDKAELAEIAIQRRDLTDRARAGRLRPTDISDATFTLSNLGMYNVDAFTAIITPPQAAILAVGRIADRVVPVDGRPGVRPMLTITLSSDHRVVDGARAATFLNDLANAIRDPWSLLHTQQRS